MTPTKATPQDRGICCPRCKSKKFRVVYTRRTPEGIQRRRECLSCHHRSTSNEQIIY